MFLSKHFQRKLWPFRGISRGCKASKPKESISKFFAASAPFPPHSRHASVPNSAASRHTASSTFSGSRGFTAHFGRGPVHGGAAIQVECFLNLADNPVLGKKMSAILRKLLLIRNIPGDDGVRPNGQEAIVLKAADPEAPRAPTIGGAVRAKA
jgi:hypothetical protein